ncbi:MAG: LptA/OstA family protein, partial [Gammaproteobacteria bacterium]
HFTVKPKDKPVIHGEAASVTYEADNDSLQLDGNVHVTRPGENFTASHVNYNLKTRLIKARRKGGGQIHAVLTPAGGSAP